MHDHIADMRRTFEHYLPTGDRYSLECGGTIYLDANQVAIMNARGGTLQIGATHPFPPLNEKNEWVHPWNMVMETITLRRVPQRTGRKILEVISGDVKLLKSYRGTDGK